MLDNKTLDGVVVAAPDHWHATMTIAACRAGKHVYCEKPLSHNIAEGRRAVRAARKYDRMVQVGIHHRSAEYIRHIVRLVRGGAIGKVHAVKNWMWTNKVEKRTPGPGKIPPSLDYDSWLGPAPEAAYHPSRVHYNFRWCSDYAGGYMTDWGVHMFNVVTFAMGVDHKGPESVEAKGTYAKDNIYDFPTSMKARWEVKDPDFTLTWDQPEEGGEGNLLTRIREAMDNRRDPEELLKKVEAAETDDQKAAKVIHVEHEVVASNRERTGICLLYTSPSPRD